MRHKLLVLTVKKFLYNRCTFTEVIAKLKLGYRFFGPPGILSPACPSVRHMGESVKRVEVRIMQL